MKEPGSKMATCDHGNLEGMLTFIGEQSLKTICYNTPVIKI